MAVNFNKDVHATRTSEYRIYPEDITVKPQLNGRYDQPDIEWLIEDILKNGQHTPVSIRNDGGKAVLVLGYSRWRAVNEINKKKLTPVPLQLRCTYTQANEQEGFLMAISENRMRNATTELDDAYNIKLLTKKFGMTEDQVALVYFPTCADLKGKISREAKKFVKDRLTLLQLSPAAEKALIAGQLKGSAARAIAKLEQEQQDRLVEKAGDGPVKIPHKKVKGKVDIKKAVSTVVEKGYLEHNGKRIEVPDLIVDWLATFYPEAIQKAPTEAA